MNFMNNISKYCNFYINKLIVNLNSNYGIIRISDIEKFKHKIDYTRKGEYTILKIRYDNLLKEIDIDKIKKEYKKLFIKNILAGHEDLIDVNTVERCIFNCRQWITILKYDKNDLDKYDIINKIIPSKKLEFEYRLRDLQNLLEDYLKKKKLEEKIINMISAN